MTKIEQQIEEMRQRIYQALDCHSYDMARQEIEKLYQLRPQEALGLLTALEIECDNATAAKQACQKLVEISPTDVYTVFLQARIAYMEHKPVTALELLMQIPTESIDKNYQEKIYNLLGQCYRFLGDGKKSAAAYLCAAKSAAEPELAALEYSNYLFNLHYQPLSLAEEKRVAADYGQFFQHIETFRPLQRRKDSKILRIGYISPDFREHVCLYFVYALLAFANRDRYQVYAYAANQEDVYSRLLAAKVDVWRNIAGLSPRQAARVIYEDRIDILVDFSGHGKNNCLPVLAYRPAPVQISGIGYFASTGLPMVDYFLSDDILAAQGAQQGFTEKLLSLPHSHFCYVPMAKQPACVTPPCLRNGYITFGSFNNFTKINEQVLEAWREILTRIPKAHLLLKADVFSYEESAAWAKEKLKSAGLPMERVECRPFNQAYLAEYQDMDIALDTFPYPGGGTSCDALYMGVPVVSLADRSHGGRFGLSLLTNLGLAELCALDVAGYVERAVLLASDCKLLQELHRTLRSRMENSPLMDTKLYMGELEATYENIWQSYLEQQQKPSATMVKELSQQMKKKLEAGDFLQAMAYAEEIFIAKPKDKQLLELMVEVCLDAGGGERAADILHYLQQCTGGTTSYQYFLQANVSFQRGDYDKALHQIKKAVTDKHLERSRLGAAFHLQACIYKKLGNRKKAAEAYLSSSNCKEIANGKLVDYSNYLLNLAFADISREEYIQAARDYGKITQSLPKLPSLSGKLYAHKKLRIGYLSADFNRHVVAYFAQVLFRNYDQDMFVVYGYQLGEHDEITEQFAAMASVWRDLRGMELQVAATTIRADEIDILVDLGGHTAHNGLPLLACRPAPVQLSAIGYFASTGLTAIDYFLMDRHTAPLGEEKYFTEKLLRLQGSHLCYQPLPGREYPVSPLPSSRNGYITFGSLNQWDKVTDEILEAWGEILQKLPEAKLILKAGVFDDEVRCNQEKKRLVDCGVPVERAILEGRSEDYLTTYERIDIALDTAPYPGGGTTCDALYMGVPVITLKGNSHHGRFGYSMLENAGLSSWCVASTMAEYVQKAVSLAGQRARLKDLRQTTRRHLQQTAVMDGTLYMRDLEAVYLEIWSAYAKKSQAGRKLDMAAVEAGYQQKHWPTLIQQAAKFYFMATGWQKTVLARYLAFAYYQQKNHVKTCYWAEKGWAADKEDWQMLYLQASAYDQAGHLPKALQLAETALQQQDSLSFELYKLFRHLRSLIGYKLGHPKMSEFYWQSFLVEKEPDMYSSYLLTFNCQDVAEEELLAKSLGYGELFKGITVFNHQQHKQHKRLRIGYISPDFRFHVMYKFYQVLLGDHDLEGYEIYAYSLTSKQDQYTAICARVAEHWRDLQGMTAQEAAQYIYNDEIDILFDLAGHTAGGSLPILARKPAPVQISGLGYMATTGLPTVDYFVTDSFVNPEGEGDRYFKEKIIRLTSQFCYTPELAHLPSSAGAPCRERGWMLFGSFNAYRKITEEMLAAWKDILEKVPNSKLLLKCQVFFAPAMVDMAYQRLQKVGFDMERVIFEPATREYMQRYLDVDIALDTYPYPGGGTTCDALYMGVPVVTRYSHRHSTRFSYSLLKNIGLEELAVGCQQEYVERAVALASDWSLLDLLHKKLRAMMQASPVMDRKAYIHELEMHYQNAWQKWAKGD